MVIPNEAIYALAIGGIAIFVVMVALMTKRKKPLKPALASAQAASQSPPSMTSSYQFTQPQSTMAAGGSTGSTEIVRKMTFTLDTLILSTVVAGFLCFLFAYLNPNGAILSLFIGSIMFVPIGMILGAMFSGNFRVKILRRITRRNFGYVRFLHSSRLIKTIIANLDNDIIRFGDGVYIVDRLSIKREGQDITSMEPIDESKIKFEEGIPTIYYDVGDIMPVDFDTSYLEKKTEEDKFRLPSQVSATLNKEIAVEKAKVMKAFRSRQNLFMVILLCLLVVNVYLSYNLYSNQKTNKEAMSAMTNDMNNLKGIIQTYFQVVQTGTNNPTNPQVPVPTPPT